MKPPQAEWPCRGAEERADLTGVAQKSAPAPAAPQLDPLTARIFATGISSYGAEAWNEHHGDADAPERWRRALSGLSAIDIRRAWRSILNAPTTRPPTAAEFRAAARGELLPGPRAPAATVRGRTVLEELRRQLTGAAR